MSYVLRMWCCALIITIIIIIYPYMRLYLTWYYVLGGVTTRSVGRSVCSMSRKCAYRHSHTEGPRVVGRAQGREREEPRTRTRTRQGNITDRHSSSRSRVAAATTAAEKYMYCKLEAAAARGQKASQRRRRRPTNRHRPTGPDLNIVCD